MRTTNLRGFTLIELLVVIAIIALLSSVVLSSLNSARNKGNDAAVKSTLNNARAQSELYYDANGNSYTNLCTAGAAANGVSGIYSFASNAAGLAGATLNVTFTTAGAAARVTCHASTAANATAWAIEAPLKAGGFYCVDSTGIATTTTTGSTLAASDAACN